MWTRCCSACSRRTSSTIWTASPGAERARTTYGGWPRPGERCSTYTARPAAEADARAVTRSRCAPCGEWRTRSSSARAPEQWGPGAPQSPPDGEGALLSGRAAPTRERLTEPPQTVGYRADSERDAVLDEPGSGVDLPAARLPDLEVAVRAGRLAPVAGARDLLAGLDVLALVHGEVLHVPVHGDGAVFVLDPDPEPEPAGRPS